MFIKKLILLFSIILLISSCASTIKVVCDPRTQKLTQTTVDIFTKLHNRNVQVSDFEMNKDQVLNLLVDIESLYNACNSYYKSDPQDLAGSTPKMIDK